MALSRDQQMHESWDDDEELQGQILLDRPKVSLSSRHSIRSESNAEDDDWQIPLSGNDDKAVQNAISAARLANIPLPANTPPSALVGGSIKRLGRQKSRPKINDDWGEELDLPQNTSPLKLKLPHITTANDIIEDDFEEWAEGSLGIRTAGLRRESKNRSSSASAMSPSMGSCKTFDSEEDGLDGLIIPTGPVNFEAALKKRKVNDLEQTLSTPTTEQRPLKFPVDSNTQVTAKEDFFDDLDIANDDVFDPKKRTLNRNVKQNFGTQKTTSPAMKTLTTITFTDKNPVTRLPRPTRNVRLEPVMETGVFNVNRLRRAEATTTSAQLLRSKRSMPALRSPPSLSIRPHIGAPPSPSHVPTPSYSRPTKSTHNHIRHDSDPTRSHSPPPRPGSRLSFGVQPETPTRTKRDTVPASFGREAAIRRPVTRPSRRRAFGDGTELDSFDDLPTSAMKESRFVKQPLSRPASKLLRTQPSSSRMDLRDKMSTPVQSGRPKSPIKADQVPAFMRDTAASRIAREQTLGAPNRNSVLAPRTNWAAQVAARTPQGSPSTQRLQRKGPTLINPMGKENTRHFEDDAAKKGMQWNSHLCRWEGNDAALHPFEPSLPPSPPRPALISNMAGTQGVQVVGGMVFDPQRMRWLKMGASQRSAHAPSTKDEEEDPFRDIEDLEDTKSSAIEGLTTDARSGSDWLVGEEFDLGPDFIRRQRDEEAAWRLRVGAWFGPERDGVGDGYKWSIRDLAAGIS